MKAITRLSVIVVFATVCFAQAGKPAAAASKATPKQYTIEQFMKTERVGGLSISANDKWLLYHSNKTGIYNVYTTPISEKSPRPITNSAKETIQAVSYFPHDNRVLYTSDQGGNELNHLYVQEEHGAARDLTPGTKLKAQFEGWSHDGSAFYVSTNERDPKSFDVYRYNSKDFARTLVFQNPGGFDDFKVDPAGRFIAMH